MREKVHIQISYNGFQPMAAVLTEHLESDETRIDSYGTAVKALYPLNVLIEAVSLYALEKLVLDPMTSKTKEWFRAIREKHKSLPDFNVVIVLQEEGTVVELPLGPDEDLANEIWQILTTIMQILRDENRLREIERVRLLREDKQLQIVCYQRNRPVMIVDPKQKRTFGIPNTQAKRLTTPVELENKMRFQIQSTKDYLDLMNSQHRDQFELGSDKS